MTSKLFTGALIKKEANKSSTVWLTNTQTAKQALKAIKNKYIFIRTTSKYYHKGNGIWIEYNINNDINRTSKKVLSNTSKNRKFHKLNPHKIDLKNIDTKQKEMSLYEFKNKSHTEKQKSTGWTKVIFPGGSMITDVKHGAVEDVYNTLKNKNKLP